MVLFAYSAKTFCSGNNEQHLPNEMTIKIFKLNIWLDKNKPSVKIYKTKIILIRKYIFK